ncbi:MAG: peptidase S8 and S53, subtilisin, kexin, sedolisin [Parcubacteria group bacterium GW2011_GWE2_39_37]|nr:MAG: peptidase S8 and S53, subtilisin, kexin, sedolisin [Parcubacteria group bacterium GW2011_GWE2_39_37]
MPAEKEAAGKKYEFESTRVPDEIIIKYKNKESLEVFKLNREDDYYQMLDKFQKDKSIEYAEPNFTFKASLIPSDTHYNDQWYLQKIKATNGWNITRESPEIIIAIIDSGIQINHPDLKNNIWKNSKEIDGNTKDDDNNGFLNDINGWDFVNNTPDPNPKFEPGYTNDLMHGTIIAGLIASEGNNATGITGVTWKTKLMPLKALNDKGEGTASNVIKAIDYAVSNGASIINLSFVGFGYSQGMDEAIKRAYDAGIIVVAAAGNESTKTEGFSLASSPMYPVCLDGRPNENRVIGVAATDAMDQKTFFSSYGLKCVDISAPGVSMFSTVIYSPKHMLNNRPLEKYYDGYWSGTSVATPIISGALALIEATNPKFTRKQVIANLLNHADNINRLNPNYLNQLGSGRLNLEASLTNAKLQLEKTNPALLLAPATNSNLIKITDQNGNLNKEFPITNFKNGISVVSGDMNYDGEADIIAGTGKGSEPQVRYYDQKGQLLKQFNAYNKSFRGGVNVAIGDVDGDGKPEIITGPGPGGGPHVKVFTRDGKVKGQFFAFNKNFQGGVDIAVGDVDGDGKAEIIAGAGPGGIPQVRIFSGTGKLKGQFLAYDSKFRGGVNVAIGDTIGGALRKKGQIITAPGWGNIPEIKIFNDHAVLLKKFLAYDKSFRGGVNISTADTDKDGLDEIITGAGPGGTPHVRIFESDGKLLNSFFGLANDYRGGIKVDIIEQ